LYDVKWFGWFAIGQEARHPHAHTPIVRNFNMNHVLVAALWAVIDVFLLCTGRQVNRYGNLLAAANAFVDAIVIHSSLLISVSVIICEAIVAFKDAITGILH
jgi:hypothetical protein